MKRSLKINAVLRGSYRGYNARTFVVLHQYVMAYLYAEKTLMPVCKQRVRVEGTLITNIFGILARYLRIYCVRLGVCA